MHDALQLTEPVVEKSKRTLGDEHPDTLRSIYNLALWYSEAGRQQEALELMEQVVEVNKRTLGDEHPDTLRSMRTLAIINETANSITEARQTFPKPEVQSQAQESNSQKRERHFNYLAKFWENFI